MTVSISTPPSPPRRIMAKDYRRLWVDVISTSDEEKAIRTLTKILEDREGRNFISNLTREDAELCIEILDHVSHNLHHLPPPASQVVSLGHRSAQPQNCRETGFLHHAEETCRNPWAIARFHDDNRGGRSFGQDTRLRWICGCQNRKVHGTPRRGEDYESRRAG